MILSELIEMLNRQLADYGDGEVKLHDNGPDYYDEEKEEVIYAGLVNTPVHGVATSADQNGCRVHLITGSNV